MGWTRDLLAKFKRAPRQRHADALTEGWFERWLVETRFLHRYPQYAGLLCRIDPIATLAVDTMAIALRRWDEPDGRLQLLVNVPAMEASPKHRVGILLHELQHAVLGHLGNPLLHTVERPKLMELAMELSANEDIVEPLPSPLRIERFAQLGVARRQSTPERYRLLHAAWEQGLIKESDWWSSRMLDVHRPQRTGACRSAGVGDLLDARSDRATADNWNSQGRGLPTNPIHLEEMKALLREHLGDRVGGSVDKLDSRRPRVAKELDRILSSSRRGPVLDWRRLLRSAFPERRRVRPDYLRPNRRYSDRLGEVPGRSRRVPVPAMLAAVDTSGSMSVTVLERVAREIEELSRFARVTVMECDAALHRISLLRRPLGPFIGGGDTSFSPVLEAPEVARFDGLIYFTDGFAPAPVNPHQVPTLWVLTHSEPHEVPFGRVVRLTDTD